MPPRSLISYPRSYTTAAARVALRYAALALPKVDDRRCVLVSAADHTHARSLTELLLSVHRTNPLVQIHVWDLGMQAEQVKVINGLVPKVWVRRFPFENYPQHFRMDSLAGCFAWKPALLANEFCSAQGLVIWMDAGNIVDANLQPMLRVTRASGVYSPLASGTLGDWTRPKTLQALGLAEQADIRNRNGALIGFDPECPTAKEVMNLWLQCALDNDCICPEGATRDNHRFDQSILTGILQANNVNRYSRIWRSSETWGVKLHQDLD